MTPNKQESFSVTKFYSKKGYKHWNGVFESYTFCTDKFIRVYSDQYKDDGATDAPYWNIERTNIGMLSTACWLNGWIALEEYSTEKEKNDNTKGSGRCDLWVSSQSGKRNYAIEAKKGSASLKDPKALVSKLKTILRGKSDCNYLPTEGGSAICDAQKLSEDEGDERMGLAFMHFYLEKGHDGKELVNDAVNELSSEFNDTTDFDFMYIYLKDNNVVSESGSIIPGVVITGKVI